MRTCTSRCGRVDARGSGALKTLIILGGICYTQQKNDITHLKQVIDQGTPLVLFDRVTDELECDKVILNDQEIAYEATKKLLKEGRKRIALATTESYFNVSEKRADGYRQALNEYGMEVDNDLVLVLPYNDIQESMIEDFYDRAKVDAILSVNEIFAIQCISVAKKRGMKIPEDISFAESRIRGQASGFLL